MLQWIKMSYQESSPPPRPYKHFKPSQQASWPHISPVTLIWCELCFKNHQGGNIGDWTEIGMLRKCFFFNFANKCFANGESSCWKPLFTNCSLPFLFTYQIPIHSFGPARTHLPGEFSKQSLSLIDVFPSMCSLHIYFVLMLLIFCLLRKSVNSLMQTV